MFELLIMFFFILINSEINSNWPNLRSLTKEKFYLQQESNFHPFSQSRKPLFQLTKVYLYQFGHGAALTGCGYNYLFKESTFS